MKDPDAGRFTFGPYQLDLGKRRLTRDHAEVSVTRCEYLLLRTLALHRGEVVPRRQLMQAIWGTATMSHGALDALVGSLRGKLDDAPHGLISTGTSSGYSLAGSLPEK